MLLRRSGCVALAVLISVGCAESQTAESEPDVIAFPVANRLDPGVLDGRTYSNHYFNFRIALPEEWYILSGPEGKQLLRDLQESAPADDPLRAKLAAADWDSGHLLMALSAPPGAPVFGSRIIIKAEAVDCDPATCTATEYLEQIPRAFSGSTILRMQYGHVEQDHKLGSLVMDMLAGSASDEPGALNAGYGRIYQRHYATRVKDHILLITIAYSDDDDLATLLEILQSIRPTAAST